MSVALFYAANVLYCLAYVVRDMVWLRTITIIAAFTTFPYFLLREEPLVSAVLWQSAFAGINVINLSRLLLERRPVEMSPEQDELHRLVFRGLTARQAKRLMELGAWKTALPGEVVVEEGSDPDMLMVVLTGQFDVLIGPTVVAQLLAGRFVAEMSFLTGDPASADVEAATTCTYLQWTRADLDALMEAAPMYRDYLQTLLGRDVVTKLRDTGTFLSLKDL